MQRIYPRIKWSNDIASREQIWHVLEEIAEVRCESLPLFIIKKGVELDQERLDEEISDLEHSIQTYWDCREREGADVEAIRQKVIEKNRARGYYREV